MNTFKNIKPHTTVTFLIPNGFGRNGQEYKQKTGKVVFAYPTHLVVNGGGRYGTPYVVDENNFVK